MPTLVILFFFILIILMLPSLFYSLILGAVLAPNKLAMGQSYEQLDKGEEGRLGKREF